MESSHVINVNVNGQDYKVTVESRLLLVELLRRVLGLTGTHIGCDTSNCGACTVILDGMAVKSCTLFAVQADGRKITTIEGLSSGGKLHPLQQAFHEKGALQCGYCTPGMIMNAYALLLSNPHPTREEIRRAISGNLCRCTGYWPIIEAIEYASKLLNGVS
ncbi:carbon monoxide dehydrogenase [Candidatus Marsarchaeota G1 archaeon OSP_D]|jgi:carbon-monoxide dehydrogenase small subunit|uniref:Carbon monoxide dehydrogenase n=2 Tax=Candidatus Marsarchaeota group 1 TaxID=2203770 RepID=A0A2R6A7K6_9ARCH|nr:MAG: carbon monoxide dehydrogenase [Candidatus Marsarchaeota G1 archaeon OSP_D]PSN87168.1 MAG: carbon monoxide dehydrogenase [Candidatus Marsarchaeota G1 archaeon OSP_C]